METSEIGTPAQTLKQPPVTVHETNGRAVAWQERTAPRPTVKIPSVTVHEYGRGVRLLIRCVALLVGLLAWQLAATIKISFLVSFENVPAPLEVVHALIPLLQGAEFYIHIAKSVQRILLAFSLAALLGVGLGILVGRYHIIEDMLSPHIELLRPIPAIAWVPLAILVWPTEESSIIFITFLGAVFPIMMNTVHGVRQTPEVLVRAAQSLGAGPRAIFWHVVLAAALPSITTGLAIGMGVSWFSLLAGEMISGQHGIGYFTWTAYTLIEYDQIIIGMIAIGLLGTLSTAIVRGAMIPFLRWQTLGGQR